MIGTEENNFSPNLFLTYRQFLSLCKAFRKNPVRDIKLSKTQLSKIIRSGRFLGILLRPLLKVGLLLMKNVLKS